MGITQHENAVATIQEISNLLETSSQEKKRKNKKLKINDQVFSYLVCFIPQY